MKFIHTADWHLGKLLKEHSMTEDQAWLLENRFLPIVDEEKPDVILLAGDVYDRSFPPEDAVELFDRMTEEIGYPKNLTDRLLPLSKVRLS